MDCSNNSQDRSPLPIRRRHASALLIAGAVFAAGSLLSSLSILAQTDERVPVRDSNHRFARGVYSWSELKQRNIVMQQRDYSCGAAVLATMGRYYWDDDVDEDLFLDALGEILTREEQVDRVENGLSMADLRRAAVKTGYQAVVGTLTFDKLIESRVPLIVGITVDDHDHFVVYRGVDTRWVYLADPIRGNIRITSADFVDQWQKNAVLMIHKKGHKVKKTSRLSVRQDEIRLGEVNRHWIRTQPSRRPRNHPRP